MAVSVAKTFFSALLNKLEKKRQVALTSPLNMHEINTLLLMRFNNKPVFKSVEMFYTEEYKRAIDVHTDPVELEKIVKFRSATQEEANILYCDIHFRDEKEQFSGAPNSSD